MLYVYTCKLYAALKIHGGDGRFAPVRSIIAPVRLLTGAIEKLKIAPWNYNNNDITLHNIEYQFSTLNQ